MKFKLLIIGHTFPEPTTTAAGVRMMQVIELFLEQGASISFATTAAISERSEKFLNTDITSYPIALNDPSFDVLLNELQPDMVLFDRFITEEQFGWRVAEVCSSAVRILDTEDLHFLRKAREEAFKKGVLVREANLYTATAKREIASILRCDVSLIISEIEHDLLTNTFKVPNALLCYLPLLVASEISEDKKQQLAQFEERKDFIAIGNLKHAPNVASVKVLKQQIWPTIRQQLPQAQLHIYGAYAPQQVQEMHSPKEGFLIMGWAEDISAVLEKAKIHLAPLPFGAGLKGKLMDAMQHGIPTITTSIGAEGMFGETNAPGCISNNWDAFAENAKRLYTDKTKWLAAQNNGYQVLTTRFLKSAFEKSFQQKITQLLKDVEAHRQTHFIGQVLQHQSVQASRYMSKWIEAKNNGLGK